MRRQWRRLSALVHPDKCRVEGASAAFQRLQAAAEALVQAAEEGSSPAQRPGKRARTGSGGQGAGGLSEGEGEEEADDSWVPDGGGFPWWGEWDAPTARQAGGGGAGQAEQDKAEAAGGEEQRQAGDEAALTAEQQDQERLQAMDLGALRAEVRQRQAALLEPQLDAEGRRVPMQQLLAALRRARTVLADRVAAAAEQRAAAGGGGFLR